METCSVSVHFFAVETVQLILAVSTERRDSCGIRQYQPVLRILSRKEVFGWVMPPKDLEIREREVRKEDSLPFFSLH